VRNKTVEVGRGESEGTKEGEGGRLLRVRGESKAPVAERSGQMLWRNRVGWTRSGLPLCLINDELVIESQGFTVLTWKTDASQEVGARDSAGGQRQWPSWLGGRGSESRMRERAAAWTAPRSGPMGAPTMVQERERISMPCSAVKARAEGERGDWWKVMKKLL
jgi:hypothetical protein